MYHFAATQSDPLVFAKSLSIPFAQCCHLKFKLKMKFRTFSVAVTTRGGGLLGFSIDEQRLRNNIYFDSERIDPKVILFDVPAVRSGATSSIALCAGMAYQESVTKNEFTFTGARLLLRDAARKSSCCGTSDQTSFPIVTVIISKSLKE